MSLIADCCASPPDEYICFSEFPVGSGFVDFALFTGRSSMEVYLIEIKGGKHSIFRKDHYGEFKKDAQDGRGQLESRADWIASHYERFRESVHDVLATVKRTGRPYHAFVGPKYKLHVDPNKDVIVHYIVIAGRTVNDVEDSRKRHKADRMSNIDIRTESWDSWVDKHPRNQLINHF